MESSDDRHGEIQIVSVERSTAGLIVAFNDGSNAAFKPKFLYENRGVNGNRLLEEERKDLEQ